MGKYNSKANKNVTYHTSKAGSYRYLKVYYRDKVLMQFTNAPVRSVMALRRSLERLMNDIPWPLLERLYRGQLGDPEQTTISLRFYDIRRAALADSQ